MEDITNPNPAPTPEPDPKPAREHSAQNKLILAYATDAEKFITTASTDEDIAPLLALHGYDAAEYALGTSRVQALTESILGRAAGMGKQTRASQALVTTLAAERDTYAKFREIAHASFPELADLQSLSLTGTVPEDTAKFVTLAKASYGAAKKAPYTEKMTRRNYAPAKLDLMLASVGSLITTGSEQDQSEGNAEDDTEVRDAAYTELKKWMKEIKGVTRGALRGRQPLLCKLDL